MNGLTPRNSYGVPLSVPTPRTGTELILTTHNFCDPTTWYTTSSRVTTATLTDSGNGLTFTSAHTNWIDMTHGKLWDEDALCADVGHGYAVVVTSDGAAKTQRAPFATTGGDYTVNYAAGTITFASSQTGKAVVASYSRMVDSVFSIVPDEDSRIDVESAKAQFSANVVINDTVDFEIWAYNPDDLPNKARVKITSYKRMSNFFDEALDSNAEVPAIGGSARGAQVAQTCLHFRYGTIRPMYASQGVELRVRLRNDQAFDGEHALAVFYCTVAAE